MKIEPTKDGTKKTLQFWDSFAPAFDCMTRFSEWRWGPYKRELFSRASGLILMAGAGTGRDFPFFPKDKKIVAVDFSSQMLLRAKGRIKRSLAIIFLLQEDVQSLSFDDNSFDSCITSCVFCSVANPYAGLQEIFRVLKPGGRILMFEHTISQNKLFALMLILMNKVPGPDLTRDTVSTLRSAGFEIRSIKYIFMDIVKAIEAVKPKKPV